MDTRRKILWFGISTAIIAGMIYFADIQKFISVIKRANPYFLILALLLGNLNFVVWTNTWHRFLNKIGAQLPFHRTLQMFMAGNFMNSITPLGQFGGEPFMAYIIEDNTDLSYEESFSAVLSSDIINAVPIFTFMLGGSIYLLFFGSVNHLILQTIYIALIILTVGGSIAYTLWFNAGFIESKIVGGLRRISNVIGTGKKRVDNIEKSLGEIEDSFAVIGEEPHHLIKTALMAHTAFVLHVATLYVVMNSLGIHTDITPLYFVIPMSGLASFSPTPGGTGTYEAAMATLLTVFLNIPFATALAIGILFRLSMYWPGILIGYASLISLGGER